MLEPPRAGLTNTGQPSSAISSSDALALCAGRAGRQSRSRTTTYGPTGRPRAAKISFMYSLSMLTALASTPGAHVGRRRPSRAGPGSCRPRRRGRAAAAGPRRRRRGPCGMRAGRADHASHRPAGPRRDHRPQARRPTRPRAARRRRSAPAGPGRPRSAPTARPWRCRSGAPRTGPGRWPAGPGPRSRRRSRARVPRPPNTTATRILRSALHTSSRYPKSVARSAEPRLRPRGPAGDSEAPALSRLAQRVQCGIASQQVLAVLEADREPHRARVDARRRPAPASSSCRCVVDATWLTIVCVPPSDVASWASRSLSANAMPASRPPYGVDGHDRPEPHALRPGVEHAPGQLVPGVLGQPRVVERTRRPGAWPARRRTPRRSRTARRTRSGSVSRPRRSRNASSGASEPPVSIRTLRMLLISSSAPGDHAAGDVGVAADVLGGRVQDQVGAVLERPADHRRRQRRVDDEQRPGARARSRPARAGRPPRSWGWRSSRRTRSWSPGRSAACTWSRSVMSTKSVSTPNLDATFRRKL